MGKACSKSSTKRNQKIDNKSSLLITLESIQQILEKLEENQMNAIIQKTKQDLKSLMINESKMRRRYIERNQARMLIQRIKKQLLCQEILNKLKSVQDIINHMPNTDKIQQIVIEQRINIESLLWGMSILNGDFPELYQCHQDFENWIKLNCLSELYKEFFKFTYVDPQMKDLMKFELINDEEIDDILATLQTEIDENEIDKVIEAKPYLIQDAQFNALITSEKIHNILNHQLKDLESQNEEEGELGEEGEEGQILERKRQRVEENDEDEVEDNDEEEEEYNEQERKIDTINESQHITFGNSGYFEHNIFTSQNLKEDDNHSNLGYISSKQKGKNDFFSFRNSNIINNTLKDKVTEFDYNMPSPGFKA